MGSKAPQPPDPYATAAAQEQANTKTALQQSELNATNQVTPYGSLTYQQTGTFPDNTPQYTATTQLNQPEQNLLNMGLTGAQSLGGSALNLLGNINQQTGQPINNSGAPGIASSVANGAGGPNAIQQAENAAYGQQTQYLNPQFQQAHAQLDNSLINQGITQGSQAYDTAQQNLGRQENQAYGNAGLQAVQAGQQEQNTLYGQGLESAQLQNAAQNQYLTQQMQLANEPLNQYNALMTGAQVQTPSFVNTPQTPVGQTNVGNIVNQGYQNQLSAYNANQQGINNLFGLGGNLGAAWILAP